MIKRISLIVVLLGISASMSAMEAPGTTIKSLGFDLKIINNSNAKMHVQLTSYDGVRQARYTGTFDKIEDFFFMLISPPYMLARQIQHKWGKTYPATLNPHASVTIYDLLTQERVHVSSPGYFTWIPGLAWKEVPLDQANKLMKAHAQDKVEQNKRKTIVIVVTPTRTGYTFNTTYEVLSLTPTQVQKESEELRGYTIVEDEKTRIP